MQKIKIDKQTLGIKYLVIFVLFSLNLFLVANYIIESDEYSNNCIGDHLIGCLSYPSQLLPASVLLITPFIITLFINTFFRKKIHLAVWITTIILLTTGVILSVIGLFTT